MKGNERFIVVGFDGMDPRILDEMLVRGDLPNFARLRELGGYSRVATTTPAQTPVAWSTFATGLNPGGHGIFDFLRRDPRTYLPDQGLSRYEQRSSLLPPKAVNLRSGATVWEKLGEAGLPSTVIRCPCTYPPGAFRGRLLAGMGVPDVRGGIGTAAFYSTADVASRESEIVHRLSGDGPSFRSVLTGPRRSGAGTDLAAPLALDVHPLTASATLRLGRGPAVSLRVGIWSEWQRVAFRGGLLSTSHGLVQFLLLRVAPQVELYASPVNFDPRAPAFPISHPWSYAAELEGSIGAYSTLGMPEDHTGLTNGRFDEDAFLAQCDRLMREREAMLMHELGRFERGLLYCLFDTPDRVQHMFWRFREADHPANTRNDADPRYRRAIEDHYCRCDGILGEVLRAVDDRTVLMVLSDHGFTSFRRGVHLNRWLADNGWLVLRPGADKEEGPADFLRHVDWGRTRAYALGFGGIYLNVAGREGEGIVPAGERAAEAVKLSEQLTGLRDAESGRVAVVGAGTRETLYHGPREADAPDVVARFAEGFRASWATALGGVPKALFESNTRKWGGDHIVDPLLVPGILLLNRQFRREGAALADCAPTILSALGVSVPDGLDGRSLFE